MTTRPSSPACPDCGEPLPADSPHTLCASCLLRQALASQTIAGEGKYGPMSPPLTPEEIADRFPGFEILECLGRGGMGVVYKARQKSLDRWVAIKIVAPEKHGEERFSGHFAREAATLAKLSHPNIVTIHDFGETDGLFFIVMEFVDGVNLRDLVRDGRLAPEQALAIVPPICDALQYAHDKKIVHRDIKPENILLDREGRVRIADFGIAALLGGPGDPAGTPPYAAPEQTVPNATTDHRADIHALGVVFYEMLTGERPSGEFIAPSKRSDTDSRLDDMVLRAMSKNPAQRFQTAAEFRTVVGNVSTAPAPDATSVRKNRKWMISAAALLVIGAIGYVIWPEQTPVSVKLDKPAIDTAAGDTKQKDLPLIDAAHISLDGIKALLDHSVNPEQAAILLARAANEIKGESRRSSFASIVISKLCNKGQSEEAWNLISPDAGIVRETQVAAWFASSKESLDQRLMRIETLRNPKERENAMRSLFENVSIDEICSLDFNRIITQSTTERQRIFVSLHSKIQHHVDGEKATEEYLKLLRKGLSLAADGWLSASDAGYLFSTVGDQEAFAQWEMIEGVKWDIPKECYDKVREVVIRNMSTENPERAIRTLVEQIPVKHRYPHLAIVYKRMIEDAPGTSVEKVRNLLSEFDERTAEQLSECIIREALQTGELELAKEWMEKITNGKLRVEFTESYASALKRRQQDLRNGLRPPDSTEPKPN